MASRQGRSPIAPRAGLATPGAGFETSAPISLLARYAGMVTAGYIEPGAGQNGVLRKLEELRSRFPVSPCRGNPALPPHLLEFVISLGDGDAVAGSQTPKVKGA